MYFFYFFSVILIYFSYKSFRGGFDYLDFFRQELAKPRSDYEPFCSIIAPCKGLDEDLEKNLQALFQQDFPNYEIIFVVDDEKDEALSVIRNINRRDAESQRISKIVISGKAENEAQKVHNLREAVLNIAEDSKVLVFVDSDARPGKDWLRNLIAPLQGENIGCASSYRWFIGKSFSLGTEMRSVWNASIASALGANLNNNFCWGGSMAIRRETFERIEMREKWRGVLSDDFAMTRAMNEANLPIFHVPQALTASVENCTFFQMLEFTTRQMKITRVYGTKYWIMSFIGSGLFNSVMLTSFLLLIFSNYFWFPLITILLVSIFSIGKSWLRLNAVKLVLRDYEQELNKQFWTQNTFWIFAPAVFFYNCVCALLSRKILWRGIKYELKSPTETKIYR
ncbi:MAG: glycosyltransferase family 2 protein [Pyrinomonadaceae bacterium]|nr:glycosyltransferase family 2 protein [Pyrinomonadaceae bacterium]